MSPSTEPKPAPRRRSKPKFEVPAEVTAISPAAWVYRHDATAAKPPLPPVDPVPRTAVPAHPTPVIAPPTIAPPAVAPPASAPPTMETRRPVEGFPDPTQVMLAAIETLAITVAAANRMFLAAASLMGAPIEVTRKILGL